MERKWENHANPLRQAAIQQKEYFRMLFLQKQKIDA